ncbi:hypothetical protein BJP08_06280 [Corynebacterium sp. NML140438]|nr:hypothetical protein BJP08_06280 [Corynebacterium sp. NML140438]
MAHFVGDGHDATGVLDVPPEHPWTDPHSEGRPAAGDSAEHRQVRVDNYADGLGRFVVDELDVEITAAGAHGLDPQVGGALDVGAVAGGVVKVEGVVSDARVVVTRECKARNVELLPPLELRLQCPTFRAIRLYIVVRGCGRRTP